MATNPYYNKVLHGSNVLIDLTVDTVAADKLVSGYTAHNSAGAVITGSHTCLGAHQSGTFTPSTNAESISISGITIVPKVLVINYVPNVSMPSGSPWRITSLTWVSATQRLVVSWRATNAFTDVYNNGNSFVTYNGNTLTVGGMQSANAGNDPLVFRSGYEYTWEVFG